MMQTETIQQEEFSNKRAGKPAVLVLALLLLIISLSFAGCSKAGSSQASEDASAQAETSSESADPSSTEDPEKQNTENDDEASEPLVTLFFASDYQKAGGFEDPAETLDGILEAAEHDGKEPDMTIFCGDYTNDPILHDYQLSPEDSISEIRDVVNGQFPEVEAEDMLFVQGNHDKLTDSIGASGLHEYDDCLIYVLNTQTDFPWKQGKTAGCLDKVTKASQEMKDCFDKLIETGETRPVFIAGHVPLHYTARTSSKHTTGDNLYSSLIFDVVNEAGKSLDIVYLFGHNHSKGWDCYMGGSSVYKTYGDTILIPEFQKTHITSDSFSEQNLHFTYMNAGYTGYYLNCAPGEAEPGSSEYAAADESLTGTVIEIYDDELAVSRYAEDGIHNLGAEGEGDPYKGGIDENLIPEKYYSEEVQSPQTLIRRR